MATEPNLRHLFDAPQPASAIDVASIVRRSRARRVPKVLGLTGVSVLAIGGLVFGGVQVLGLPQSASDTAGSAPVAENPMMSEAGDSDLAYDGKRGAAENLNHCGAPLAEVAPSATGLVLSVDFPDAAVGSDSVQGSVVMTNTGSEQLVGYTGTMPAITFSREGIVLWHTPVDTMYDVVREVSLAPGESIEYEASFSPVICESDDEVGRDGLPAAPAGDYQVSAAVEFMGEFDAELVTGPASTSSLR